MRTLRDAAVRTDGWQQYPPAGNTLPGGDREFRTTSRKLNPLPESIFPTTLSTCRRFLTDGDSNSSLDNGLIARLWGNFHGVCRPLNSQVTADFDFDSEYIVVEHGSIQLL